MHDCISIAINLTIVFAEIVNCTLSSIYFVHPPFDEILATPLIGYHWLSFLNQVRKNL